MENADIESIEYKVYTSAFVRESRTKKTKWTGILRYKDAEGNWKQIEKNLDETRGKKAAEKELKQWRYDMEMKARGEAASDDASDDEPLNVGDFVARYIDTLEYSRSVERSTLTPYRAMQKHIAAGLGSIRFDELDADAAQKWVNGMNEDGYAVSTIRKAFNLLKAAYSDAVERRVLPYNPIGGKAVKCPKQTKKEPNALDAKQLKKLLDYLDIAGDTPVNLAIWLALNTGMREQELCGLRWKDVDSKAGVLHICNVIGRDGGTTYEKQPKTGGSRRDIPISPKVGARLKSRRAEMAEECMEAGVSLTGDHHVLGDIDGSYMRPHTLWREWKAIAKSLGLVGTEGKVPVFHDLRHTYATWAIKSGADVKSVSSILGHANAAMTLNIYASADAEAKRRTMERTERAIAAEAESHANDGEVLDFEQTGTDGR